MTTGAAMLALAAALVAYEPHAQAQKPLATAPATEEVARCDGLRRHDGAGIVTAMSHPAGAIVRGTDGGPLPAHCEVIGTLDARTGIDGQHYAIRYHLRLPERWNGRFLFQGGGGTNGELGDATGPVGGGAPAALAQGFAVVSQDSGHDNAANSDPAAGGQTAFGADPIARANYGHASLKRVADVAKAVVARFYGRPIDHSYFMGCSKGGQEGMAFAQRYPDEFDGIVAAAPGFSLPKAALAQAWNVQTFGALVTAPGARSFDFRRLPSAFSDAQLARLRTAVLDACDALDGLRDGIVDGFARCTTARIMPALARATCAGTDTAACLTRAQVTALLRWAEGPRDGKGRPLYAAWTWDGGVGSGGWRVWTLGSAQLPALNILTGGPALATMFTVPPTAIRADPQSLVDYEVAFDWTRDAPRIFATSAVFPRSGWEDNAARSTDLAAFRAHGGKMIVPHGVSDPVFSIRDTLAWYGEVDRRTGGQAASFARVFPVPGMAHCTGGPATSGYDALTPLVAWVEQARAPDRIVARAGRDTPFPGRTRPLCPSPKTAHYSGRGSIDQAENFTCENAE